jgi:phosphodiesterase/alkaline phosphatase D-like protein
MSGSTTVSVWTKFNPDKTEPGLKSTVFFEGTTNDDFFTIVLRTPGNEGIVKEF